MREFNLEEFVKGVKAQTRSGLDAEYIGRCSSDAYPIVARIYRKANKEKIDSYEFTFTDKGNYLTNNIHGYDLFMKDEEQKHEYSGSKETGSKIDTLEKKIAKFEDKLQLAYFLINSFSLDKEKLTKLIIDNSSKSSFDNGSFVMGCVITALILIAAHIFV